MLVWYDPEDPHDVQVCGRKGRSADQAFVAAGVAFMLAGAGFRVHPLTGAPARRGRLPCRDQSGCGPDPLEFDVGAHGDDAALGQAEEIHRAFGRA
jgi:hypothetical protein